MEKFKELLEAIAALKKLIVGGKMVLADGKLTLMDLPTVLSLLQDPEILAGIQGAQDIPGEFKNLTLDDIDGVVLVLKAVADAFKAVKSA